MSRWPRGARPCWPVMLVVVLDKDQTIWIQARLAGAPNNCAAFFCLAEPAAPLPLVGSLADLLTKNDRTVSADCDCTTNLSEERRQPIRPWRAPGATEMPEDVRYRAVPQAWRRAGSGSHPFVVKGPGRGGGPIRASGDVGRYGGRD